MNQNQWWGYLHVSGTLQAKRYFEPLDIQEAHESPFCKQVFGPFVCEDRDAAIEHIKNLLEMKSG